MKTRILMSSSAAFLAVLGVGITFMPQELLTHVGVQPVGTPVLLVQLLGALYFGFAILNWMNRGNRIGGIYNRGVSMANFFHFGIGAVSLVKGVVGAKLGVEALVVTAIYSIFGVWFGVVLFTHPADAQG